MDRGFRPSPSAAHLFVQQDVELRRRPHHWQPLVFPSWHSRYTRHSRRRSSILCLHSHSTPTPSQADDGSRSGSGSVSNPREHPYRAVDLYATDTASSDRLGKRRPELAVMVERQRDKWPWTDKRRRFNPSKTRYGGLKAALLDPEFGFTTPSPSAIVSSVDDTADGGAVDADEGTPPARCVHSTPTGPTANPPTAASDHDRDVDPGCSHSGAGPASTSMALACRNSLTSEFSRMRRCPST
ncbi:hypothetical protein BJV78DRAFT_1263509 [Lactifluus subvellereus]|nr:hypothetical protein BJV78DRAFT_1263509 [Lactifluus subvellereus]